MHAKAFTLMFVWTYMCVCVHEQRMSTFAFHSTHPKSTWLQPIFFANFTAWGIMCSWIEWAPIDHLIFWQQKLSSTNFSPCIFISYSHPNAVFAFAFIFTWWQAHTLHAQHTHTRMHAIFFNFCHVGIYILYTASWICDTFAFGGLEQRH